MIRAAGSPTVRGAVPSSPRPASVHYRPNTGDNGGGRQRGRHRRPRAGLARVPCGPCPVLRAAAHDLPQPDPDRGDRAAQGPVTPGESVVVRARIVPGEIILFGVRVVLAILHRKGIPLGTTRSPPAPGDDAGPLNGTYSHFMRGPNRYFGRVPCECGLGRRLEDAAQPVEDDLVTAVWRQRLARRPAELMQCAGTAQQVLRLAALALEGWVRLMLGDQRRRGDVRQPGRCRVARELPHEGGECRLLERASRPWPPRTGHSPGAWA